MIMTIQAPDEKEFADFVEKNKQVIIDFFVKSEINRQINLLKENIMMPFQPKWAVCLTVMSGFLRSYRIIRSVKISCGLLQPCLCRYEFRNIFLSLYRQEYLY